MRQDGGRALQCYNVCYAHSDMCDTLLLRAVLPYERSRVYLCSMCVTGAAPSMQCVHSRNSSNNSNISSHLTKHALLLLLLPPSWAAFHRALCAALELPWQSSMLHWAPGPKPYDGVWAPWWYGNTHKATGFDFGCRDAREPLPDRLKPLLGECWPTYELLRAHALRPAPPDAVPRCVIVGRYMPHVSHLTQCQLSPHSCTFSALPCLQSGVGQSG